MEELSPAVVPAVAELIRRNFVPFEESRVHASTLRRLEDLTATYSSPGCRMWVLHHRDSGAPIGCVGVGPFQGLAPSEAVGEIRDLVVDLPFRGQGLGRTLLRQAVRTAEKGRYHRLYLETGHAMTHARQLFRRQGFRPVTERNRVATMAANLPCYFVRDCD